MMDIGVKKMEYVGKTYVCGKSLVVTIPQVIAKTLNIDKGDVVKISVELVEKKASINGDSE